MMPKPLHCLVQRAYGHDMTTLLTTEEAAARAGVARSTITRWVASGRLRAEQTVGRLGVYLFDPADVDQARRTTRANGDPV